MALLWYSVSRVSKETLHIIIIPSTGGGSAAGSGLLSAAVMASETHGDRDFKLARLDKNKNKHLPFHHSFFT